MKGQPRVKHAPLRTCVACRQRKEKRRLTRVVYAPGEGLVVDPTGKRHGRGAYLCDDPACWDKAGAGRLLDRALRAELSAADRAALAARAPGRGPKAAGEEETAG